MIELDGATALRLLREVVAERPDYVYEPPADAHELCVYQSHGEPSCVVGHVLARAGWPVRALIELDRTGVSAGLLHQRLDGVTEQAATVLAVAQNWQDVGGDHTWAGALAAAERLPKAASA